MCNNKKPVIFDTETNKYLCKDCYNEKNNINCCHTCYNTDTSEEIIHDKKGNYICVKCYCDTICNHCNNSVYEKFLYEKNIESILKISKEIVCLSKFFNKQFLLCPYCVEKHVTVCNKCHGYKYNNVCYCSWSKEISEKGKELFLENVISFSNEISINTCSK